MKFLQKILSYIHRKNSGRPHELRAFTLIELLIVMAIIALLAVGVIVAVNPWKNIISAQDTQRHHNATELESAMYQHLVDNYSLLNSTAIPDGSANAKPVCRFQVTSDGTCVNLDALIPAYMADLPTDQAEKNASYSGYLVYTENSRVRIVPAHLGELGTAAIAAGDSASSGGTSVCSAVAMAGNWVPNGTVYVIAQSGGTIYIGGNFTSVSPVGGGAAQARNYAAAFDSAGNLLSWNPSPDAPVHALVTTPSAVYMGGEFANAGGGAHSRIAAVDNCGTATSFNASADNTVFALVKDGNNLYMGGTFTTVDSQTRNHAAAVSIADGSITAWDPNTNSDIYAMATDGTNMYMGGNFFLINNSPIRYYLASTDLTNGTVTSWNPTVTDPVSALAINGSTIYVGGDSAAAYNTSTGTATGWSPAVSGTIHALAFFGSTVYAGGTFDTIGGANRNNAAALSATTGTALAWNPNANDNIFAISANAGNAYLGGSFTTIGGTAQTYYAKVGP
ncbi:MAG: hypothetical protein JWM56_691 [Candidatus Peribacteria bacterium]|nr:hypothetical protein [Candidatus Peribacteria bacterium]